MRSEKVKLKDIATWGSGGTPSRKQKAYFSGDIMWFKTAEAGPKFIWESEEKITSKALFESSAKLYPAGSVVIAMYAGSTIGNCSILGVEASTNQAFAVAVCDQNRILNEYLYYFIISQRIYLQEAAFGGTQDNLTLEKIQNWEIELPKSLDDQRVKVMFIEQHFKKIDSGIYNLVNAEQQLKLYRQSVLKDAFEGKLTADWRAANPDLVEPADKLLERIEEERKAAHQAELATWEDAVKQWEANGKDGKKPEKPKAPHALPIIVDELSLFEDKIPKDWFLGTVGHLTNGVEYGSSSKSKKKGSYPVLRMGNLQSGELTWDELVFTDDEAEFKKYELNSGDILFNRTNSPELVGKSAIFRGEQSSLFAGYLIRVNQIDTICLPQFLNFFLNSSKAKQYGNLVKTDGVNQSNINGKKLLSYPIPICSIEEQKEIVLRIQKQFDAIKQSQDMFKKMSQQSSALKQSILKQAFSGYDLPKDVL